MRFLLFAIISIFISDNAEANCDVTYSSDTAISNTIECADNQTMTVNKGATLSQASGASGMINIVGEENFTLVNNGTIDPGQSNAWQAIYLKDATSFDITNNGSGITTAFVSVAATVGFGTGSGTATGSVVISGGQISAINVVNPGAGYTHSNPPAVLITPPTTTFENCNVVSSYYVSC